jgi:hypothetical protein
VSTIERFLTTAVSDSAAGAQATVVEISIEHLRKREYGFASSYIPWVIAMAARVKVVTKSLPNSILTDASNLRWELEL